MRFLFFMAFLAICTLGNSQLSAPAPSPRTTITQRVGLTDVTVTYSRPGVKGRTIFGKNGLVPDGEYWRTGANSASKITFSEDVKLNNIALEKGTYVILSTVENDKWTVHFYADEGLSWSKYIDKMPQISISAPIQATSEIRESFFVGFENLALESCDLVLAWDRSMIAIPLMTNTGEKMEKQMERYLNGTHRNDFFQAAVYLHETNKDLNKALEYIRQVTNHEDARFFQVYREAAILEDLGMKSEAKKAAQRSLKLSQKSKNNDFVRLNESLIARVSR